MWDLTMGKRLRALKAWPYVSVLAGSPDGQLLAWTGDGGIRIEDWEGKSKARILDGGATTLASSADGARLAAGARDGKVVTWDVSSRTVLRTLSFP